MAYSPVYEGVPFTDFASVTCDTELDDLNLNWREQDLPERFRTKHVHRLHPYLGKFVPQLVEIFLRKYQPRSVLDPFSGSGTTLVEANALGIPSTGYDISPFNCLLSKVKTAEYDVPELEAEIRDIVGRVSLPVQHYDEVVQDTDNEYLRSWFATPARLQLLLFRSLIEDYKHKDLLKVVLSRAARSARHTTHFDLDFPKQPQTEKYYCYKHGRTCQPTDQALRFITRYAWDTLKRVSIFSEMRTAASVEIVCADSRTEELADVDMVLTSPPYVGLINYHEQHRYAYELLNEPMNEDKEIGAAKRGNSELAQRKYLEDMSAVFGNVWNALKPGGVAVVVVHDRKKLYGGMADKLGFAEEAVIKRHVNRRTGRRSDDFYESVLVWRKG